MPEFSFDSYGAGAPRQLARHYLNNPVFELNEAAYFLRYEDGNSFVRTFRTYRMGRTIPSYRLVATIYKLFSVDYIWDLKADV